MLSALLQHAGYRAIAAPNGYAGRACLQQHPVDLILSDRTMPQLTGDQLYQIIRADPRYQVLPFILTSADPPPPTIAADPHAIFLPKPFQPDTLLTAIATMIDTQHAGSHEDSR